MDCIGLFVCEGGTLYYLIVFSFSVIFHGYSVGVSFNIVPGA